MRKTIVSIIAVVAMLAGVSACGTDTARVLPEREPVGMEASSEPVSESAPDPEPEPAPEPVTEPKPVDVDSLAAAVIRGEYGDGEARQAALGDNYEVVQARVDELLAPVAPVEVPAPVEPTPAPVVSTPSAGPTGTPAQQWAWWVSEYADPSYPSYDALPACINEDGSGQAGPCKWDSATMGNHEGSGVYIYDDGSLVEQF